LVNEKAEFKTADIQWTADLVSAYVSNNHVAPSDLPALIASVQTALSRLAGEGASPRSAETEGEKVTSAQIRKSVTPDAIISFLDGKPYKTLKRHLTKHGLDPSSYRAKYGLPADYPMVAPSYSETRSSLARSLGLGQVNGRGAKRVAVAKGKARKSAA
jgi:predicted transcriptional regulator